MCYTSVTCNNYFYSAWPIPVSYLTSADTEWIKMTACV